MEDLIVNSKEHILLKKFQRRLQMWYNVTIHMPNPVTSAESDIIFISIYGEKHNRERVKQFLSKKMNATTEEVESKESIIIITLSDSDEEPTSCLESKDDSVAIVEDFSCSENSNFVDKLSSYNTLNNSVCVIESPIIPENFLKLSQNITNNREKKGGYRYRKMKNKMRKGVLPSAQFIEGADLCEVSSTTEEVVLKKAKLCENIGKELVEFIPLHKKGKTHFGDIKSGTTSHNNISKEEERKEDIVVLHEPLSALHSLRPIVIDGSNVARDHGKVSNTFSAKGIQLAVDYFLNRGHSQVTAFVPKFRRFFHPRHNCPTTDSDILDDLAKKQLVVFTPSRKVNGKCIASYDDRFIVQLASTNGGVIVSNDNYRDLITENDSFKEAIEKRLLMFCFVGDIFMIPSDPLGRDGPSLSDFLSFSFDSKTA